MLISAVSNVLMFSSPIYMLQVYDSVLPSGSLFTLAMLSAALAALLLLNWTLEARRGQMLVLLSARIEITIAARLHQKLIGTERGETAASIAIFKQLDEVTAFISSGRLCPYLDIPWSPLFIVSLFFISPSLGTLSCVGIGIISGLAAAAARTSAHHSTEHQSNRTEANRILSESVNNIHAARAMGMWPVLRQHWESQRHAYLRGHIHAGYSAAFLGSTSKTVRLALQSAALGVGAWLAVVGEISPGMMIVSSILMGRALTPVDQITSTWKEATRARRAWRRVRGALKGYSPERGTLPARTSWPASTIECGIESCSPPGWRGARPALSAIQFRLEAGEVLGVIGPSGAGKTTLLQVLTGNIDINNGDVCIGGEASTHWRARSNVIGYLLQDIALFAGTIKENITRFEDAASSQARLEEAIHLAGLEPLLARLAEGGDTQLGPGGRGLSVGQRQRVALARAVYARPAVVILDEPGSHQDACGRAALIECIKKLRRLGIIVIVTTHQMELLSATDKVLSLESGRTRHLGETRKALESSGFYPDITDGS
uniref:type I secretion system permease/ATPase n=1 Tax=Stenotrophomonas sp. VV52 TaxID=2066958 RepID=UPI0015586D29